MQSRNVGSWVPCGGVDGILQVCVFAGKIPVGIPQVRYLNFCGFVPIGISQDCGFAVKIPVGIRQVVWLRGQVRKPLWPGVCGCVVSIAVGICGRSRLGYLKFVASPSRSRLEYLKFVRLGYLQFVLPGSGSRLGYVKFVASQSSQDPGWNISSLWLGYVPVGIPQVGGFVVTIPVRKPQVRSQDPGWGASSLCLRCVASLSRPQLGYLKFVASWSRPRLGYLKFCGFVAKIPARVPQV